MEKLLLQLIIILVSINGLKAEMPFSYYSVGYNCGVYDGQRLDEEKIKNEPIGALWIIRKQIYASHGKEFKDSSLQKYFEEKPWYRVNKDYDDSLLSPVDIENIKILTSKENSIREKFKESDEIKKQLQNLQDLGFEYDSNLNIIDVSKIDLDNDNTDEIAILSIPYSYLAIYGHIDPGVYTKIQVFKLASDNWKKILIDIEKHSNDPYFNGEPIDGILTSFTGSNFVKINDINENGLFEIYTRESALSSTPGYTNIFEYRDGKMKVLFREALEIIEIADLDNDGFKDITTYIGSQKCGWYQDLYPCYKEVFKYSDSEFIYSKNLTISYLENLYKNNYEKLKSDSNYENYIEVLRILLYLSILGIDTASIRAENVIKTYHSNYVGKTTQHGIVPSIEKTLFDFKDKIRSYSI